MNTLSIYPVSGLYRELYYPTPELIETPEINNNSSFIDANSLFWANVLSEDIVGHIVNKTVERHNDLERMPVALRAIISDYDGFKARVLHSKAAIVDQSLSPQQFFSHIETLNLYCALYATMAEEYSAPFNIQSGWVLKEDSSEALFNDCLDEGKNPYLGFIKETIMPLVEKAGPKIVFILGRPGYFSCALARLLKTDYPSVFICATRHSSEYYSMNKIDFLLTRNAYLFQMYDAIILEHFASTEQKIAASVAQGYSVAELHNLICRTENGIVHTGYGATPQFEHKVSVEHRPHGKVSTEGIPPSAVTNVHLFPFVKCYWNQCAFCGINKKYHFDNPAEYYDTTERFLSDMKADMGDASFIWFIDEAIPPAVLQRIANYFKTELPGKIWQARCRIERSLLTDGLPELLAASGLRELRLGLESGSYAVLKKMNKFDTSFSFSLVEEICKKYSECGISIHFPMIVGFPGENGEDRRATYNLLQRLSKQYAGVTFNVNVFGLDVGSTVFQRWYDFDVQSISFPCAPQFFMGNLVQWQGSSMNLEDLSRQRDQFMRETLYPWLPTHCITPPHILYRLSETIRDTLVWKYRSIWPQSSIDNDLRKKRRRADLTVFYSEKKDLYYIYSWYSHHYMLGNKCLIDLLDEFFLPNTLECALNTFISNTSYQYQYDLKNLKRMTERLISDGYLIECE